MMTADVNLNEFNRRMNAIVAHLNLKPRQVFEKELGELVKTLVRISPPKNLSSARRKAERDVRGVYRMPPEEQFKGYKIGRKNTRWLYASKYALVGVDNYNYNTDYSAKDAKTRLYQRKGKMGSVYKRVGTFGKGSTSQAIQIIQRKIIKRGVFRDLVSRIKNNFGRQKAAWMIAVGKGEIKLSGGNLPPSWVRKHIFGARGATINELNRPSFPAFTLINRAVGVSKSARVVSSALRIRAKAMARNLDLAIKGVKQYAS